MAAAIAQRMAPGSSQRSLLPSRRQRTAERPLDIGEDNRTGRAAAFDLSEVNTLHFCHAPCSRRSPPPNGLSSRNGRWHRLFRWRRRDLQAPLRLPPLVQRGQPVQAPRLPLRSGPGQAECLWAPWFQAGPGSLQSGRGHRSLFDRPLLRLDNGDDIAAFTLSPGLTSHSTRVPESGHPRSVAGQAGDKVKRSDIVAASRRERSDRMDALTPAR